MQKLLTTTLVAQLAWFALGAAGCASVHNSPNSHQEAVLVALVALHAGPNCTTSRPQGIQQLASLQEAVSIVNTNGGIPIGLRVYDTCSTPENSVKVTLQALVAAEEDTCLQPPFFLGFVGPDDTESVDAVSRVVHVFNLTHVAPWRLGRPIWPKDHTLHVANTRHDRTAQAVLTLMRRAGWKSFLAAHSGSADASQKTKVLLQMAAGSEVCSVSPALRLPTDDIISKLQQGGEAPSGAVLVVDSKSPVEDLVSRMASSQPEMQILVVSSDPELIQNLPVRGYIAVLLLLESAAGETLTTSFQERLRSRLAQSDNAVEAELPEDVSVAPLAHAVRLYGAALRVAQTVKCPGLRMREKCVDQEEWHAMMAGASVLADDVSKDMISFSAELPTMHQVYLSFNGSSLHWVGNITDGGKKLHLASEWILPAPPSVACTEQVETEVVQTFATGNLWPSMANEHGFYEAVGMLAGAGTSLVGLLVLCTWVVYRSFRVPGRKRSPPSSVSSYTHRS